VKPRAAATSVVSLDRRCITLNNSTQATATIPSGMPTKSAVSRLYPDTTTLISGAPPDASGRIGSVKDPIGLPPYHACPPPRTVQDSARTTPATSVHGAGAGVASGALIEGKGSARAVLQADITLDGVRVPAGNVLAGARAASKAPLGPFRDANRRTGKLRSSGISHARAAPGARRHRRAHN
jgi:hypothetical protein